MSNVNINHITKTYGNIFALNDVSLDFADGDFFGLLGPSGSGKTTLLRSIAGFVVPTKGEIIVDGTDIRHTPVHKRDIGMVFQNYALFPHMSVFENIAYSLSVRGVKSNEINTRVRDSLELVQLGGYGERRPRELSGGQQQRIALARALVSKPRVLLLDEPLGALDKNLRTQMQVELRQIQREVGITTILVTHDQEEALTMSDRVAIFCEGKVIQTGSPDEIYEKPRTAFAAEFFGSTNFLEGTVLGKEAGLGIVRLKDDTILKVVQDLPPKGSSVSLTVRPEKVLLGTEPEQDGFGQPYNEIQGTVDHSVFMGFSIFYQMSTAIGSFHVFQQNREIVRHEIGNKLHIRWIPEHTVVLDEE